MAVISEVSHKGQESADWRKKFLEDDLKNNNNKSTKQNNKSKKKKSKNKTHTHQFSLAMTTIQIHCYDQPEESTTLVILQLRAVIDRMISQSWNS